MTTSPSNIHVRRSTFDVEQGAGGLWNPRYPELCHVLNAFQLALPYLEPSSTVQVLEVDGKPSGVQLPSSVELAVSETEPGVRGDTVSNVTKPATLETGAIVQVPLFVNVGDRIKVDPREGRYISRA